MTKKTINGAIDPTSPIILGLAFFIFSWVLSSPLVRKNVVTSHPEPPKALTHVAVVNMENVKSGVPTVPPDPAEDAKLSKAADPITPIRDSVIGPPIRPINTTATVNTATAGPTVQMTPTFNDLLISFVVK